jgi:hypothetical protein
VTKDGTVGKPGSINPGVIDAVITLSLRQNRIDKGDIVNVIAV